MAFFKSLHADAVLLGEGEKGGDEPVVHYPGFQVAGCLGRCTEVGTTQEFLRAGIGRCGIVVFDPAERPEAVPDTPRTRGLLQTHVVYGAARRNDQYGADQEKEDQYSHDRLDLA